MTERIGRFDVELDLKRDITRILRKRLIQEGYDVDAASDYEEIGRIFFNARKRRIPQRPRRVLKPKSWVSPPEFSLIIDAILDKAERGDDLTPHQSRKIFDDYNDRLLNEWDVQHFHLSLDPHPGNSKLLKGTPELLFARVTNDAFYVLAVLDHNAWHDRMLVQLLHDNWPNMIAQFRANLPPDNFSDEQRRMLREANVIIVTTVQDSTTYFPIGGGPATDGTNINVTHNQNVLISNVRGVENQIRSRLNEFEQKAKQQMKPFGDSLRFEMINMHGKLLLVERNSGFQEKIGDLKHLFDLEF